jgi:pilus assembly protein CpaC
MKTLWFAIFLFCFTGHAAEVLILPIGSHRDFKLPPSAAVRVGKRSVLSAVDMGPHVRVFAKNTGESTLILGSRAVRVQVVGKNNLSAANELREMAKQMLGPRIEADGEALAVRGQIHRLSDWEKFARLAGVKNIMFRLYAGVDDDVKDAFLQKIREELKEKNLPLPVFIWRGGARVVFAKELEIYSATLRETFEPYGFAISFEKSQIQTLPLVRIQITVAEVSRNLQRKIGVEWPHAVAAQLSPKLKGPEQLGIFLHALEDEGLGHVLASPTLLARSGGEAEFLAGGEIPIRLMSGKRFEVIWKRHGIYLQMKPHADLTGRIKMSLTTEVTMLSGESVDGLPGLKTNRISSQFDLEGSQTIVLSGLVRNDWFTSTTGLPGLKDIPILGRIFNSQSFIESQSELVIFVTPQVLHQGSIE